MVDALRPAADTFQATLEAGASVPEAWREAVLAAKAGTDKTERMRPKMGRASYLGDRAVGVADAGASAVVVWMEALSPFVS